MMHKFNRLFHGRKCLALCAAMILMITSLSLPLQAKNPRNGRDDRGIMGDIRDGVRRFGRDVSDAIDPDGDGILPDGSIDNGIADDGNQNTPDNEGGILPGMTSDGNGTATTPDTPAETGNDPTPGTDDANRTDEAAPGTTAPTTAATTTATTTAEGEDNAPVDGEGGFRWTGLIIALVIVAAVVLIIILLVPKKKH